MKDGQFIKLILLLDALGIVEELSLSGNDGGGLAPNESAHGVKNGQPPVELSTPLTPKKSTFAWGGGGGSSTTMDVYQKLEDGYTPHRLIKKVRKL